MPDRPSPLLPLKTNNAYRAFWLGFALSSFGTMIQSVGAAWLMTSIAGTPGWISLVQASVTLPVMLFSVAAGVLADVFDRKAIMLSAQLFMFAVSIALAITTWLGLITPSLLLAFTFLLGCGTALNNPAWQASIGDLVPRDQVASAVSLNSIAFNVSRSVGPAIGGFIVATAGVVAAFALNALSYVALLAALLHYRPEKPADTLPREHLASAMTTGLRYVFMSPRIEVVLLRAFHFGFAAVSIQALLPLVARDMLGGGPLVFGALLGAFGIGAVGGGVLGHELRERLSSEWFTRLCSAGIAVAIVVVSLSTFLWLSMIALMLAGACWLLSLSYFNISVQLSTPRWVVGRALAAYQTAAFGGMAMGAALWGYTADELGLSMALQISAVVMLVGTASGLFLAMPDLARENLDPINRWNAPKIALDLRERSGPIVVQVEYEIRENDLTAFLEAMRARRQVRRRNGAIQWTLMRDLERPDYWIETFHIANWTEYVRHHTRTTFADAEVTERIRKLHAGEEAPVVRRMIVRPPKQADAPKPLPDQSTIG
ncbi:MFS transporter [Mesorhizobium sp. CAU 1732]|uniref:MFS transporter n=1 Tax=Mesorhizobium sp. CAU 1732 TaxID=3140358 RepID=UPI00326080C9